MVLLLVKHEGSDGPTGVGTSTGLATDTNGGMAPAILILSTRDSASGHRHSRSVGVEITEVVDGE